MALFQGSRRLFPNLLAKNLIFPRPGLKNCVCWVLRIQELLEHLIRGFAPTVIVEIFFRYFVGASLYWSNELATYLFIYMVLFGGSVALKQGGLINI